MPLSCNLGTLTSWHPLGHSRPVTGLLCLLQIITIFIFHVSPNLVSVHPWFMKVVSSRPVLEHPTATEENSYRTEQHATFYICKCLCILRQNSCLLADSDKILDRIPRTESNFNILVRSQPKAYEGVQM